MAVYYIDSTLGKNSNDGLTPSSPIKSHENLELKSGDIVLFKRGTSYRTGIKSPSLEGDPITYSSYGEGAPPVFYGSRNYSGCSFWKQTDQKNIWKLDVLLDDEPCNIVFNHGDDFGKLAWSFSELNSQGKWWSNTFGKRVKRESFETSELFLYSCDNPGLFYEDIEIALFGTKSILQAFKNTFFDGLHILNSGVHGFGISRPENVLFNNCIFENIGGCVWDLSRRIRYGNGVECWDGGKNVTVSNCEFKNIFDSCFTTQGSSTMERHENITCISCTMEKFGMAAYEIRDRIGKNILFENNFCTDAGYGFALNDEPVPRYSEIYPEPMGHHIFIWRGIPTGEGHIEIRNNTFRGKPTGQVVYTRSDSLSAASQISIHDNIID